MNSALFGIPGAGDVAPGLMLVGLSLVIGTPLLGRAIRHSPMLNRMSEQMVLWRTMVYLFTVLWMLPYYLERSAIDAVGYHGRGQEVARLLRAGQWSQIDWGFGRVATDCIVGFLYVPFGANLYAAYFISALLGLGGVVFLVRAFAITQPHATTKTYAALLVFLPSFGVWSTTLGKDSIVSLGLGMSSYGYGLWREKGQTAGFLHLAAGTVIVGVIRPHIALLVLMGAIVAELFCTRGANQHAGAGGRVSRFAAVAVSVYLLWPVAKGYVGLEQTTADAALARSQAFAEGNLIGGSAVETPHISSPLALAAYFPAGVVKVLFRPFPWEAHNLNSALAAAENLFLLFFVLRKAKSLPKLLAGIRRSPYCCFCLAVVVELLVVLGPFTNLGLLSRERVQLLPFLFAFLLMVPEQAARRRMQPVRRRGSLPARRQGALVGAGWAGEVPRS